MAVNVKKAPRAIPALYNADMVRALMDGRKMHTRRPMKPQPVYRENNAVPGHFGTFFHGWNLDHHAVNVSDVVKYCPLGKAGDLQYVRETFFENACPSSKDLEDVVYRAGGEFEYHFPEDYLEGQWTPSIHMPRWASRITLDNKNVRVERVQDISPCDCLDEGIDDIWSDHWSMFPPEVLTEIKHAYMQIWNAIYAKPEPRKKNGTVTHYESYPWDEESADDRTEINGVPHYCYPNPYVWVVEFEVIKQNIDEVLQTVQNWVD